MKIFLLINILSPFLLAQEFNLDRLGETIKESETIPFIYLPTIHTYREVCQDQTSSNHNLSQNIEAICEVVLKSELCAGLEKSDQLSCHEVDSLSIDGWELIKSCAGSALDSAKDVLFFIGEILKWSWETISSSDSRTQTKESFDKYSNIVQHYMMIEYFKAYQNSSGPFKSIKAANLMSKAIGRMLVTTISDLIGQTYAEFGCLNTTAKSKMICEITADLFIPPTGAIGLIKYGPKALKKIPQVNAAFVKLKEKSKVLKTKLRYQLEWRRLNKVLKDFPIVKINEKLDFNLFIFDIKNDAGLNLLVKENEKTKNWLFGIFQTLNQADKFNKHLRGLLKDVVKLTKKEKISAQEALKKILDNWEADHGFLPAFDLTIAMDSSSKWNEMLKKKALFNDVIFGKGLSSHGNLSHRLQWHLVMREMKNNPKIFLDQNGNKLLASDMYKMIGEFKSFNRFQNPVWEFLFDQTELTTGFSKPENFERLLGYSLREFGYF